MKNIAYPSLDPMAPEWGELREWAGLNGWMPYTLEPVDAEDATPVALALIRQVFEGADTDTTRAVVIMIRPDTDVRVWCCPDMWEAAIATEGAWWHRSLPATTPPEAMHVLMESVDRELPGWLTQALRSRELHALPDGWVPTPLREGQWRTKWLSLT